MAEADCLDLQGKIDALPIGGMTMKTIDGHKHPYLQHGERK